MGGIYVSETFLVILLIINGSHLIDWIEFYTVSAIFQPSNGEGSNLKHVISNMKLALIDFI